MDSNVARKQNIFLISVSLNKTYYTIVPLLFLKHHQLCSLSGQNMSLMTSNDKELVQTSI